MFRIQLPRRSGSLGSVVTREPVPAEHSVLDDLPFAIWIASAPTGNVVYANPGFRTLVGAEDGELDPVVFYDREGKVYAADGLPFNRAIACGRPVVIDDLVIHHRDGSRAWLRAFANPVRDGQGEVSQVVVAFTDITAEVQAVVARAQVEKHLAVAIHHAPVLLFMVDRDGVLTAADGELLERLERGRRGMVGQSLFETYKNHPTVPNNLRRALAGETVSYSVDVQNLSLDVWLGPVRDAAGELAGAIGVCTDVTEARRLQAGVVQDDRIRAMGTVAASVAHEINNPLTYVTCGLEAVGLEIQRLAADIGDLQSAKTDASAVQVALAGVERLREALVPVLIGTDRIRQVTQDLRTFTRRDDEFLTPVDLASAVRSALKLVRKEIEARARLVREIGATPLVLMNEARLSQILVNLLTNAWQAIPTPDPAKHVIGVRTATEDGRALLEVWDSGPGVPPEHREQIFEPYVTTKAAGMGTGLGLFVCRKIVRSAHGQITVHDGPCGGALFRVVLPSTQPVDAWGTTTEKRLDSQPRRPRILIIDDDAMVAGALASQVAGDRFDVRTVLDGRQGLDILLGDDRLALAYCDVMMQDFTGIDLYEALQKQSPERLSKVVFMTGGAYTGRSQVLFEQCPDACVHKPFDILADARRRIG